MAMRTSRRASNLPADVTSFVGRRHELSEARRLLSRTRLLTLTGVGGVGKTRLALRVAEKLRRTFPDGVWQVELASLQDPGLLAQTVAAALGLRDQSARSPAATLAEYLADKRLLLVLDNCDHLLDACAELVDPLLRAAPGLRVLVTSRQALGVNGEHVLAVFPLSVPDPDAGPLAVGALEQYEAVTLFADRAAAVLPEFALDASNVDTVVRLCQRLDGIPLAIELAAVRLRALSLQQLLNRVDDFFELLSADSGTVLPRQRTLRSLIGWSFDLCSPEERLLWTRLSVFSGGFDLDAAEEVCPGEELARDTILPLLAALVDKSILLRDEYGSRVRYRLLETVRQYGRERLAHSGEEDVLRARQRDHYLRLARQAEASWQSQDQVDTLLRLRRERANLRVALDYCLTEPGQARVALDIAATLWSYWIFSGSLGEGRRWLDRALALDPHPTPTRAKALWVNSFLALLLGDMAAARPMLAECQELGQRLGDAAALAYAAQFLGLAALFQGDYPRAVTLVEEALAGHRARGDRNGEWVTLYQLALTATLRGDARAEELCTEVLALCEARGTQWTRSYALWVRGLELWRRGDPRRSATLVQEAIRLKRPFDDQWGIALCLEVLAWVVADTGEHERAARLLGAASMVWRLNGTSFPGHVVSPHHQCEEQLSRALGDESFQAAFRSGTDLTLNQTMAYALGEKTNRAGKGQALGLRAAKTLTRREWEIAELVAQGLSNKEVAHTLVIAQRTAEAHVEHILRKLGFTSRSQIAAWVAAQKPHTPGSGRSGS